MAPAKDHAVIAGDGAAAQRRKADIARPARAGEAVTAARRMQMEIDAAARRRRLAQHQGGARRRVDLGLVVHLQNFDIEIRIERLCHPLYQRRQQIDAEAHIADFTTMARWVTLLITASSDGDRPGGADDMDEPR